MNNGLGWNESALLVKHVCHIVGKRNEVEHNPILNKSVALSYATRASRGWACMPRTYSRWIVIHRPYVKKLCTYISWKLNLCIYY